MHECLLCERDMNRSKNVFGSGCTNNLFKFLNIEKPNRCKNKEQFLYKNIMQRTNISKLDNNQKIWLTDRYLTYQYLDKLKYGNFTKLKAQINEDISKVNQVSRFEELTTSRRIKLKEAYELYKKEQKFNTNIEKLKQVNPTDDKNIKLILASISFIFNMNKNKNQYENNNFKAMQYAFWQTVIEVGGKYKNYEIAADFLQHSLEKEPTTIQVTEGEIVDSISENESFKNNINEIVKQYGKNNDKFSFDSNKDKSFPLKFNNNDLYFAINRAELKVIGNKQNEKWNLKIEINDTYDYTEFKWLKEYLKDTENISTSILSSTLYNLAHVSMKVGVMKEYDVSISFEMNDYEVF